MGRIAIVGTGLIGGSVGLALGARGYDVAGFDHDEARLARAKELGAITEAAASLDAAVAGAELVVVAVPVGAIANAVVAALDAGAAAVTDVGSVKKSVVADVERQRPEASARFVGGHPMAGSEQDGVDGADATLFVGATWTLTPTANTDERAYTLVLRVIRELGADVVSVAPDHHDELVAMVSHVPQLAASTLMDVATTNEEDRRTLMRLAAGGFRDMTRIAAGHPAIWPDILTTNREAVLGALDTYIAALSRVRDHVEAGERDELLAILERARVRRRNLPASASMAKDLVEIRIPVPDRPGVFAEVSNLAGRLGVNVEDVEVAHSSEGDRGVMVLVVAAADAGAYEAGLHELGYKSSKTDLA
ncbi:MAG: prephenate dehydrogenase [Actinomycetota bacterium]|nr:prephenate dehydrogenase [Actinomycetota bacterium]